MQGGLQCQSVSDTLTFPPPALCSAPGAGWKARGWSHRAWAPGRTCPTFHWRVRSRGCKSVDAPCKGGCPTLVHRADTRAHPCMRTHTRMHTCAHTHTELVQQPPWNCHCHLLSLSTASKAETKGTAVQSHPTRSQTRSHLPETLETTDLLGGIKPRPIAHVTHPTGWWIGQGRASSRDRAGHFERRWVYNHPFSWRLSWLPALPTRTGWWAAANPPPGVSACWDGDFRDHLTLLAVPR